MTERVRTPGLASKLIAFSAPGEDRSELLGDLEERFRSRVDRVGGFSAKAWYCKQALQLFIDLAIHRTLNAPMAVLRDFRSAIRSLSRVPSLVIASVLVLGIGIGAPATMFSIVQSFLSPLPVRNAQEIVDIELVDVQEGRRVGFSRQDFEAWQGAVEGLSHLAAYWTDHVALSGGDAVPSRYSAVKITPEVFALLEASPVFGRLFDSTDLLPAADPVLVISEAVWEERFGRDSGVLGRLVRIDGKFYSIVGVLPREFGFPHDQRLWMPLRIDEYEGSPSISLVGRARADASFTVLEQQMRSLVQNSTLASLSDPDSLAVNIEGYTKAYWGSQTYQSLLIMTWVVSFLVVIAAVNVASLITARGAARTRDVAVRLAVGGSRLRVVSQLVTESLVLSLGGGLLGLVIAFWGQAWFRAVTLRDANLLYWIDLELGPPVVGFTAFLVLLATLSAGLIPALRTSGVDLVEAMKREGQGAGSLRMGRLLPSIVGVEMALSCALLMVSTLIVVAALRNAQPHDSFPSDNVLTGRIVLEDFDYPEPRQRLAFVRTLDDVLSRNPEIAEHSLMSILPGKEGPRRSFRMAGEQYSRTSDLPNAQVRHFLPSHQEMFDQILLEGRRLDVRDSPANPLVAVVNRAFVDEYSSGDSIIGQRIHLGSDAAAPPLEIVGVLSDPGVTPSSPDSNASVFLPIQQHPMAVLWVTMRSAQGAGSSLPGLLAALQEIDPQLPVARVRTMQEVIRRENAGERILGTLFGAFGLVALVMAATGLSGVIAFSVSQRRQEIGVRLALGARSAGLFLGIVGRGLRPALIGVFVGTVIAFFVAPLMGDVLDGIDPHDPLIYICVIGALVLAGALAASVPASSAVRIDPIKVLRVE